MIFFWGGEGVYFYRGAEDCYFKMYKKRNMWKWASENYFFELVKFIIFLLKSTISPLVPEIIYRDFFSFLFFLNSIGALGIAILKSRNNSTFTTSAFPGHVGNDGELRKIESGSLAFEEGFNLSPSIRNQICRPLRGIDFTSHTDRQKYKTSFFY